MATTHFFLPAEMETYPTTDSTFEHVLKSTWVGKIGLPADMALVVNDYVNKKCGPGFKSRRGNSKIAR